MCSVYVYAFVYVHVYVVCVCVHVYAHIYECVYKCICLHVCIYTSTEAVCGHAYNHFHTSGTNLSDQKRQEIE